MVFDLEYESDDEYYFDEFDDRYEEYDMLCEYVTSLDFSYLFSDTNIIY